MLILQCCFFKFLSCPWWVGLKKNAVRVPSTTPSLNQHNSTRGQRQGAPPHPHTAIWFIEMVSEVPTYPSLRSQLPRRLFPDIPCKLFLTWKMWWSSQAAVPGLVPLLDYFTHLSASYDSQCLLARPPRVEEVQTMKCVQLREVYCAPGTVLGEGQHSIIKWHSYFV